MASGSFARIRSSLVGLEAILLGNRDLDGTSAHDPRERELANVFGIKPDNALLARVEVRLRNQEEELAEREKRLAERELSIVNREQSLERMVQLASESSRHDVRRNERCPCGSGVKYKRCHGRFD